MMKSALIILALGIPSVASAVNHPGVSCEGFLTTRGVPPPIVEMSRASREILEWQCSSFPRPDEKRFAQAIARGGCQKNLQVLKNECSPFVEMRAAARAREIRYLTRDVLNPENRPVSGSWLRNRELTAVCIANEETGGTLDPLTMNSDAFCKYYKTGQIGLGQVLPDSISDAREMSNRQYRDPLIGTLFAQIPGYDPAHPERAHMKMMWKPKAQVTALFLVLGRKQELAGESPSSDRVSQKALQRYNGSPDQKAYALRVLGCVKCLEKAADNAPDSKIEDCLWE